ncbi:hypothetical protein ES705_03149 [subsurface metagenome]|jgi:hypothetical protein|uniref:Uncharacterized protein n=1 Tax=marine sediment metagenome TaxID=412755 RepID=X1FXX7_9ZZZZ
MSLEADKKNKQEPVIVEVQEYDNIKIILSKIIVPFSEIAKELSAPDVYSGCKNIPFENRDPFYKSVIRHEFADAMRSFRKENELKV